MFRLLVFIFVFFQTQVMNQEFSFQQWLEEISETPLSDRRAAVDRFFTEQQTFPLVERDSIVTFIYRGAESRVSLAGDVNLWNPAAGPLTRIDSTNFWYRTDTLPPDARLEYKFVLDDDHWILDPLNHRMAQGGFGYNSEVGMPEYKVPPEIKSMPDIPRGVIQDTLFYSKILGNSRKISVYLPPGYFSGTDSFSVIFFNDGSDYLNIVNVPAIIDNMIRQKKIQSVVAVFVPEVSRFAEYTDSLQVPFSRFFMEELWGWLHRHYRLKGDRTSHAIVGASASGNMALWMAVRYTGMFGKAASQSGYVEDLLYSDLKVSPPLNIQIYLDVGAYDLPVITNRVFRLVELLDEYQYQYRMIQNNEGHNWSSWRARIPEILQWFFPAS